MKRLSSYVLSVSILAFLCFCAFAVDTLTINPTQYGQFFFLLFGVLILLLLAIIRQYLNSSDTLRFGFSSMDFLLVAVFLFCTIRSVSAYGGVTSLPLNYLQIAGLLVLYFIFKQLPLQWLPLALIAIISAGAIEAMYGNAQLYNLIGSYNGIYKVTGTFYNPGPFAGFISLIFAVALNAYLYRKEIAAGRKRTETAVAVAAVVALVAMAAILPSSRSRAAIIATIVSATASLLFYYSDKPPVKERLKKLRYLLYPAAVILFVVLFGFLYKAKERSADGRLLIWRSSVPMIADAPVFGYGFGKFSANYMNYQAKYLASSANYTAAGNVSDNVYYPYNEFIRIFVEYGVVGGILVCLLLLVAFRARCVTAEYNVYLLIAKMGLLAFIIFSFFSYSLEIVPILVVVTFFLSLVSRFTHTFSFPTRKRVAAISLAILLPALIFCWIDVSKLNKGYRLWYVANLYYQSRAYNASVGLFAEADKYIQNDGLFLSHYGKALAMDSNFVASVPILSRSLDYVTDSHTLLAIGDDYASMGDYNKGGLFYKNASLMVPTQLYPKYCLAKLLLKADKKREAQNVAREIMTMDVKVPSPATTQIKLEMSNLLR